jgi:hypothetical protein
MVAHYDSIFASTEKVQLKQILILWVCAFFFHTVADPTVTYIAVILLDAGVEANPFLQQWIHNGLFSFIVVHIPLYVTGFLGFLILRWLFKQGADHEQMRIYYLSIIVLSAINLWGVLLVFNNLWVILSTYGNSAIWTNHR